MINHWKRKKGNLKFNPGRKYVQRSVENFLNEGGEIKRLEASTIIFGHDKALVDDFLMGDQ